MTWPAASLVARGALYTALILAGAYILFLVVLLLAGMLRAGSLRARRAATGRGLQKRGRG